MKTNITDRRGNLIVSGQKGTYNNCVPQVLIYCETKGWRRYNPKSTLRDDNGEYFTSPVTKEFLNWFDNEEINK